MNDENQPTPPLSPTPAVPAPLVDVKQEQKTYAEQCRDELLGEPEADVSADVKAVLQKTFQLLLRYCGWDRNYAPNGVELPMSRPQDVQDIEIIVKEFLSSPAGK